MEHIQISPTTDVRTSGSTYDQIATAPGDLPAPEVQLRFTSQIHQFRHDNTIVPLAPEPGQQVQIEATSGSTMPLRRATLFYTTDASLPTTGSPSVLMEAAEVDWQVGVGYLTRWRAQLPGHPNGTIVRYRIGGWCTGEPESEDPSVWAHDGQGFHFADPEAVTVFAYSVEPAQPALPEWMMSAVIYQIFLDRFHPGTPDGRFSGPSGPRERHGGTLDGVRHALPYLSDLHVTCLWLSPLHPSETFHRYDSLDYMSVDSALGGNESLRALVNEAHARNMRVVLDFVPNHCSWHHPAFIAAQRDRSAASASWFIFDRWPDKYRTFLGETKYLPTFNTQDEGARQHLIRSAVHWLEQYGVDGYRLDHAIGPGMDFWVAFRQAIKDARYDAVAFGEATDTPDSLRRYRGRLHGVLDFPLARALRLTFATEEWNVCDLDAFLAAYERYMESGPGRVSFLDNHDMERFLFLARGDTTRLKLGAMCLFTLSATPVIYYGTEIGLSQRTSFEESPGGDSEARLDMPWNRDDWNQDVLDFFRDLIQLRRQHLVLQQGGRRTAHLDNATRTYAYLRTASGSNVVGAGDLLVAFNMGDAYASITLPTGSWSVMLTTKGSEGDWTDEFRLRPRSGAVLRRD